MNTLLGLVATLTVVACVSAVGIVRGVDFSNRDTVRVPGTKVASSAAQPVVGGAASPALVLR
ncbi:MAG: hypothetical protein HZA68_11695 [Rhodovulum sp.]|nr:hypothetical protein [Rhodovulum sp.]